MITGAIKNKVDKIWLDIYAGGITQPLTVIEQLTYLMFIRSLDEKEIENEGLEALEVKVPKIFPQTPEGQAMRWSKFKDKDARKIFELIRDKVFPFIKALNGDAESAFSRYMEDALLRRTRTMPSLLSYLGNFEFFREYKQEIEAAVSRSTTAEVFARRIQLIFHLQKAALTGEEYQVWRRALAAKGVCPDHQ
jgi:hypothetical protein